MVQDRRSRHGCDRFAKANLGLLPEQRGRLYSGIRATDTMPKGSSIGAGIDEDDFVFTVRFAIR
jgi:hypothetical protein